MTATSVEVPELVVAEVFGPTFQGEGPSTGRRASFIRLGGCNLHCTWCDTPYTWDARRYNLREQLTPWPVDEIVARVAAHRTDLTVITGGEPLLHQHRPGWPVLLDRLDGDVEIETNGTVVPTVASMDRVHRFNVSPKLAHAGDPADLRIDVNALRCLRGVGTAIFKFVCREPSDLDQVEVICRAADIPAYMVWIMAEGTRPADILAGTRALADPAISRGYNLTTRLHTLTWPDEERGR